MWGDICVKTKFVVFSGGLLHSHFVSSLLVYSTCVLLSPFHSALLYLFFWWCLGRGIFFSYIFPASIHLYIYFFIPIILGGCYGFG